MDVPYEFLRLGWNLRDAVSVMKEANNGAENPDAERAVIAKMLERFDEAGKHTLKKFLTGVLTANSDEKALQELWKKADSNYYLVGKDGRDGTRTFLTMIRDQID